MDWNRISANWAHWKGRVRERWGRLTDDQLAVVGGRREQLASRIQAAYGLSRVDAERQLRNWERNLAVEDFVGTETTLDEDAENPKRINGTP